MQAKPSKLTARDFVYVYEPGIGQTYQNGPYLIRPLPYGYSQGYRVYYQHGPMLTMTETFLSAIEACARHDEARPSLSNQNPRVWSATNQINKWEAEQAAFDRQWELPTPQGWEAV
jgi:hypothetical protein